MSKEELFSYGKLINELPVMSLKEIIAISLSLVQETEPASWSLLWKRMMRMGISSWKNKITLRLRSMDSMGGIQSHEKLDDTLGN